MSMTKISMVENMRIILTEMHDILDWAGIGNYLSVPQQSEELNIDYIREGYKWIIKIRETVARDAIDIWKLLPRSMWERYELWGEFSEHRESIMLGERLTKLKKAVKSKSRPDFFKRGIINGKIKKLNKKRDSKASRSNKARVPKTK